MLDDFADVLGYVLGNMQFAEDQSHDLSEVDVMQEAGRTFLGDYGQRFYCRELDCWHYVIEKCD